MANYTSFYFTTESGKSPVEEFIDSLDYKTQRKFFFKKSLLEEFGQRLPYPHAKYIGDDIYELRFEGKAGTMRVLYFSIIRMKLFLLTVLSRSQIRPLVEKKNWRLREEDYF